MLIEHAQKTADSSSSPLQAIERLYKDSLTQQKTDVQSMSMLVALQANDGTTARPDSEISRHREQFHRAARRGDEHLLTYFLGTGININLPTANKETALHLAVKNGHEKMALVLIAHGADHSIPGRADKAGEKKTVLGLASEKEQVTLVEHLLRQGEKHSQEALRQSLLAAIHLQNEVVVPLILKRLSSVAIDYPIKQGRVRYLHAAAKTGNTSIIMALLNSGADIGVEGELGRTVLHYLLAGSSGSEEALQLLISYGANVNAKDRNGNTPMHKVGTWPNSGAAIRLLAANGADINAKDRWGDSPLDHAARQSYPESAIRCLLDLGAVPPINLLHLLARNSVLGAEVMLQHFLEISWDPNSRDKRGQTVLHRAVGTEAPLESALRRIRLLVDHGADCFARSNYGETLLHSACKRKKGTDIVHLLLEYGLDLEAKDNGGRTALLIAAQQYDSSVELINLLIDRGANVYARDNMNQTALFGITLGVKVAKLLVHRGVDVNARDNIGRTALFTAVDRYAPSLNVINILIDNGVDINARDNTGRTALFTAVDSFGQSLNVINILIDNGADINASDNSGQTALFAAVGSGKQPVDAARLLIDRGADVDIQDADGQTFLMSAWNEKMKDLIRGYLDGTFLAGTREKM